jgi:hypothetical protein
MAGRSRNPGDDPFVGRPDQFAGRLFGEIVLEQYKRFERLGDANATMSLIHAMTEDARPEVQKHLESWIDQAGAHAQSPQFWRRDAMSVLEQFGQEAADRLREAGIEPTDDDTDLMTAVAFLSLAYTLQREPRSKVFVQKALGIGFLGRLLG